MKITKEKLKKIVEKHEMLAFVGKVFLAEMEVSEQEYIEYGDFFQEKKAREGE